MGVLIDWLVETETSGEMLLVAIPGGGDVGKLAIDAVNSELDAEPIARMLHPALPPLAILDDNGLLMPPHILLSRINLDGKTVYTLTGNAQPMSSEGQCHLGSYCAFMNLERLPRPLSIAPSC